MTKYLYITFILVEDILDKPNKPNISLVKQSRLFYNRFFFPNGK